MKTIREIASPNHDSRPQDTRIDMLLLHYTGMETAADALRRLTDPEAKVSAHYVIDEDGTVIRMVEESRRAWHAGEAAWGGETDINSCSIGIELVNPGHEFGYRPYTEPQMTELEILAARLVSRYEIPPGRVLGHSDVAPTRKADPGELFDWERLAKAGVGIWPSEINDRAQWTELNLGDKGAGVAKLQADLSRFGYQVDVSGSYGGPTTVAVSAFQRHYRPGKIDGIADHNTRATLAAVLAAAT